MMSMQKKLSCNLRIVELTLNLMPNEIEKILFFYITLSTPKKISFKQVVGDICRFVWHSEHEWDTK